MRKLLLALCLLFFGFLAQGQLTPYGIRKESLQKEIMDNTKEMDSLILIDGSSFWSDSLQLKGFGFSKNELYRICIQFKHDSTDTDFYCLHFITYKGSKTNNIMQEISKIGYDSIQPLNNDSLDRRTVEAARTKQLPWPAPSDRPTWSIMLIDNVKGKCILRYSYNAEAYLKRPFNKQIATFDSIFVKIWNLYIGKD